MMLVGTELNWLNQSAPKASARLRDVRVGVSSVDCN